MSTEYDTGEEDLRLLKVAREVLSHPAKWGHSDVGDVLVAYLKGRKDLAKALEDLAYLRMDYLRG